MRALPHAPADRHQAVAADFRHLVEGASDWAVPAPVPGWTARDVVGHLVEWLPAFLATGGIELPPGPSVGDDPVAAWQHHAHGVQTLLEERADESFTHPFAGTHRLAEAIDRFYTADVFMHSWDLARATGQDVDLDDDFAAALLEGMRQMEDVLRGSGQYGPPVAVRAEAPVVDRLMGFIGRDPDRTPTQG